MGARQALCSGVTLALFIHTALKQCHIAHCVGSDIIVLATTCTTNGYHFHAFVA